MVTWLYDGEGKPGAFLDDFCIRSAGGDPSAWVFGLSVFSLKGDHIGWFEGGVLFDVDNRILAFTAGAVCAGIAFPPLAAAPAVPSFSKRPHVPTLRARPVRQAAGGWSLRGLAGYLDCAATALPAAAPMPVVTGGIGSGFGDPAH